MREFIEESVEPCRGRCLWKTFPHLRTQMQGIYSRVPVIALTHRGVHGVALTYRPVVPFVSAPRQEYRYADAEIGWVMVHTSRSSLGLVKEMFIGATAENTYSYVSGI